MHREGAGAHNHAVLDRNRGRAPANNIAGTHWPAPASYDLAIRKSLSQRLHPRHVSWFHWLFQPQQFTQSIL